MKKVKISGCECERNKIITNVSNRRLTRYLKDEDNSTYEKEYGYHFVVNVDKLIYLLKLMKNIKSRVVFEYTGNKLKLKTDNSMNVMDVKNPKTIDENVRFKFRILYMLKILIEENDNENVDLFLNKKGITMALIFKKKEENHKYMLAGITSMNG